MWWQQILLGIPAVLMAFEAVKALSPWPLSGRAAPLTVAAVAFGVSYLPVHGHLMIAMDSAMAVPLLMKYLGLSSSYQHIRLRPGEVTSRALLAWDDISGRIHSLLGRRGADHETAGTMLPPNVGRRIPSL